MMTDSSFPLRPATAAEIKDALSFGLRWDGRKRMHRGDELMAKLMAEHLLAYLEQCNFVVMRKSVHPADNQTHYNYSTPPADDGDEF